MIYGGIEAGGTKFICAIGNEDGEIIEQIQIPTTSPKETMQEVISFFRQFTLGAIGIGSFGPCDINPKSDTYGCITSTPKKLWRDYSILGALKGEFEVPIIFNTDVNVAALAETKLCAAKGLDSCLYITVGTGIGAGAVVNGQLLHGLSHPEMGHIIVRRHPDDVYEGKCPYHGDCLEGLAAGPAIGDRWGKEASQLASRLDVWELQAFYIAQALMHYILILSPKKIILGGGVMKQKQVFSLIYNKLSELLNSYIDLPELSTYPHKYIVSPGLGDRAGIIGALILAQQGYHKKIHS
jgi:fructokinase